MARLIYVPVMHSIAEMGSAGPAYQAAFVARFGERKWRERTEEYDAVWRTIEDAIAALRLDLTRVKLYQDSLPVCGAEAALVAELAAQGSHNHQLLQRLAAGGARLVGAESPALLLEEYRLLQSPERSQAQEAALLEQRDEFIARRIDETLEDDEIGLLFMGALHHVASFLPPRIEVDYLRLAAAEARC
jgi:hypothetical protein